MQVPRETEAPLASRECGVCKKVFNTLMNSYDLAEEENLPEEK
jgi:hypothetical protein